MNEKFTNTLPEDADFARQLETLSEQTAPDPRFARELEHRLKTSHKPRALWWTPVNRSLLPSLGWVALVVAAGLALIWTIQNLVPKPQPGTQGTPANIETSTPAVNEVIENTPLPAPDTTGYDWRGTTLYLNASLPQLSVDESLRNLYLLKQEQPPSMDVVQALATQFGIEGEVYKTPSSLPGNIGYLVTDGKQRLYIQSAINFSYYADYPSYTMAGGGGSITDEQAASAIEAFMASHGLTFPHRIENPRLIPGMYYILPLLPDGSRLQYDYNMPARIEATVDANGQVILLASYRTDFETLDGAYGVISAEEAFQQVLDSSNIIQNGVLESMRSMSGMFGSGFWNRVYPDNETVTIYGQPQTYPASAEGGAPFIGIGQYPAIGNVAGIESVDYTLYLEATGQYVTENGIRKFNVDSWKLSTATETYLSGSLRDEGGQIILTAEDGSGEYVIEDLPADVPLNTVPGDGFLSIHGFTAEGKFSWDTIQYLPGIAMGGGGGGGGTGFYQLNLSGTPVPFPTPTLVPAFTTPDPAVDDPNAAIYSVQEGDTCGAIAQKYGVSVQELITANNLSDQCIITIGQTLLIPGGTNGPQSQVEKLRGILAITIYEQTDGSRRTVYSFFNMSMSETPGTFYFYLLEGDALENLGQLNGRPIDVWGTVVPPDDSGVATIRMDRFEVPFPDLQYQILKGTQTSVEVDGLSVLLFTDENGNDYVELTPNCVDPFGPDSMVGQPGDSILIEALPVPGVTFGDYPAVCVYSSVMAVNPKTNQPMELPITADQPSVLPEPPSVEAGNIPTATIESVELVYYIPNPAYGTPDPKNGQYIQPAWRFQGHYSDGSEFEILVQALRREYLLPEVAPHPSPG